MPLSPRQRRMTTQIANYSVFFFCYGMMDYESTKLFQVALLQLWCPILQCICENVLRAF